MIPNPITDVKTTWPRPVSSATDPVVRIRCRSSLSPTRNSRTAIPTFARSATCSVAVTRPNAAGPTRIPTAMYATINGWRNSFASPPTVAAMIRIAAI